MAVSIHFSSRGGKKEGQAYGGLEEAHMISSLQAFQVKRM
jgi:hypothetical protein